MRLLPCQQCQPNKSIHPRRWRYRQEGSHCGEWSIMTTAVEHQLAGVTKNDKNTGVAASCPLVSSIHLHLNCGYSHVGESCQLVLRKCAKPLQNISLPIDGSPPPPPMNPRGRLRWFIRCSLPACKEAVPPCGGWLFASPQGFWQGTGQLLIYWTHSSVRMCSVLEGRICSPRRGPAPARFRPGIC